jgi:hypothetical protein
MTARLARAIVYLGSAVIPDASTRARYREQWLADVDGAAEVGLTPIRVAVGAATAAVRMATTDPRSLTALMAISLLPRVSDRARRAFGLIQLIVASPYLWAVVYYGYARLRLGVSHVELLYERGYDPKDLIVSWLPPMWAYGPVMVWMALGGWVVSAMLTPVGLLFAVGGRGWARWLPVAGTIAGVAVVVLAQSEFGGHLRIWLLD